jgi:hypothetical protein
VFLGDNLVSRSSTEAKYWVVANGVAVACWLRQLLQELHAPLMKITLVYYDNDNINVVYLSTSPIQHQRIKQVEMCANV